VIEEKTKGNLTPEESEELKEVLAHLRARFVQIARMVAAQMQRDGGAAADPLGGVAGSIGPRGSKPAAASGLIMPDE
jgi:hypothetical protein